MKTYGCRTIPGLRERMNEKQATVMALAEKSGVCNMVVQKAASGQRIKADLADFVEQALEKYNFSRSAKGKKAFRF